MIRTCLAKGTGVVPALPSLYGPVVRDQQQGCELQQTLFYSYS